MDSLVAMLNGPLPAGKRAQLPELRSRDKKAGELAAPCTVWPFAALRRSIPALCLLVLYGSLARAEIQVSVQSPQPLTGELKSLDVQMDVQGKVTGQITLLVDGNTQEVSLQDAQGISTNAEPLAAPAGNVRINTVNGSSFWVANVEGDYDTLTFWTDVQKDKLKTPVNQLTALELVADGSWSSFAGEKLQEDRLVIRKAGNVDALDGLFVGIHEDAVKFKPAGLDDAIDVPRQRVLAILLRQAEGTADRKTYVGIRLRDGGLVQAIACRKVEVDLEATLMAGLVLRLPWNKVSAIELAADPGVYLDSLATEKSDYGAPLRSPSLISSTLEWAPRISAGTSGSLGQTPGAHYMEISPGTSMRYRLDGKFKTLTALLGLAPGEHSPSRIALLNGDQVLWENAFQAGGKYEQIEVPLQGAKALTLVVDGVQFRSMGGVVQIWNAKVSP